MACSGQKEVESPAQIMPHHALYSPITSQKHSTDMTGDSQVWHWMECWYAACSIHAHRTQTL